MDERNTTLLDFGALSCRNTSLDNIRDISLATHYEESLKRILSSEYSQCHMCNGYYGSNNSQPICTTCHYFLFPVPDLDDEEDSIGRRTRNRAPSPRSNTDSEDSGTEQPRADSEESCTEESDSPSDPAEGNEIEDEDEALLGVAAAPAAWQVDRDRMFADMIARLDEVWLGDDSVDNGEVDPASARHEGRPAVLLVDRVDAGPARREEPRAAGPVDDPHQAGGDRTLRPAIRSPAYLLHLKSHELKKRVRELTRYNPCNYTQMGGLVESLPPEVLLLIFQYLDDFGLYAAKNVCTKWATLIEAEVPDSRWEVYVNKRWPLFSPRYNVNSWSDVYSVLVNSTACIHCLPSMVLLNAPPICEKAWKHRRLASELRSLQKEPPEGIQAVPLDKDCRFFQALILGPKGSPYEKGRFYLYLQIPKSYPLTPPHVQFITKVLHPNVSRHGDIGIDSITHNWSLALTLSKLLLSIQSLLTDPYLKICMEPDVARLYKEDRNRFNQAAREWTWKYAMTEVQQVYFGHVDLKKGFYPMAAHAI